MQNPKILENAHKIAFLVQQYPNKNLKEIIETAAMPALELNTAMWQAVDLGLISEPDKETGEIKLLQAPEKWELGENVENLKAMIVYGFQHMAKSEQDLDEENFGFWTLGYNPRDILIAMKQLLEEKVMATYELTDPKDLKSTYTFYTLYENGEQLWGRKNFKEQPTGEEVPDNSDQPTGGAESEN